MERTVASQEKLGRGLPPMSQDRPRRRRRTEEEAAFVFSPNMEMRSFAIRRARISPGLLTGQALLSKLPPLKLLPMRQWRPTQMVLFCHPPPGFGTSQASPGWAEAEAAETRVLSCLSRQPAPADVLLFAEKQSCLPKRCSLGVTLCSWPVS